MCYYLYNSLELLSDPLFVDDKYKVEALLMNFIDFG